VSKPRERQEPDYDATLVPIVKRCLRQANGDIDHACEILDEDFWIEMTPDELREFMKARFIDARPAAR
jgi:hypothetical protein